jgi:tetratricopeptide (TPR) repeat protein
MSEEEFGGTSRFQILAKLGAGGMGVVYRAQDREQGREVALKTLQRFDPTRLYKLKHEFRALSGVAHKNLVSLYELMSEGNRWFFTMELVEGVSFRAWVSRSGPGAGPPISSLDSPSARVRDVTRSLEDSTGAAAPTHRLPIPPSSASACDVERLRSALRQLASGVHALHQAGQVHCDIKPSNVLVTPTGRVVLLDFGLVRELRPDGEHSVDGPLLGTPAYMSPEQAAGEPPGPASDWYSVGVLLYEALTGRLPFSGTMADVLNEKQCADPALPSTFARAPADLEALCMTLLQRCPQDRPGGNKVLALLGGALAASAAVEESVAPAPIFVGRRSELEALWTAYSAIRQGTGVTLHIHGRSGIGKTALVARFLDLLRAEAGVTVLAGRCYERETVPYKALDSLVDALSRHLLHLGGSAGVLLPRDVRPLVRLFPVLEQAEVVASAPLPAIEISDPKELRRRATASVKELLGRIADRGPLVLWIDDLQWGDLDSAALLIELIRPPDAPAALLLLSYRSEDLASSACVRAMREQDPATGGGMRELLVNPLTPDDARELAKTLLKTADAARAAQIAQEAEGHPLFVAELAQEGETAQTTLEETLRARVARLEPDARCLLEVISVAGGPIAADAAVRAAGIEDSLGTLAVLRAGRLVRAGGTGDNLEAYHDRIRETVTRHLDAARLRACHAALAHAIEGSGRGDPEALAIHFREAGDSAKAGVYATTAAAQAASALAFDRAARLYRLALELEARGGESARLLRAKLGDALANAGRGEEAARAYLAAAEGANGGEALELRRRAMEQFLRSGHFAQGFASARAVLEDVGMSMPATRVQALAFYLLGRAQLKLRDHRYHERDPVSIPAQDLTQVDVCYAVAHGLMNVDFLRGAGFQTRHLLLALRAGETHRIARALAFEVVYSGLDGEHRERTSAMLQQTLALAEKIRDPYATGVATLMGGTAVFFEGSFREAYQRLTHALDIFRNQPNPTAWEISSAQAFAVRSLTWMGDLVEQRRVVGPALTHAEDYADVYAATIQRTFLAYNLVLKDNDLERAKRQLDQAMARWPSSDFHIAHFEELLVRTWADLYVGHGLSAWERFQEKWPAMYKSMQLSIKLLRILMLYLRASSALAVAADGLSPERFLGYAARDTRRIEREKARYGRPMARVLRAGIAHVRGDDRTALDHLEEAEPALAAADMMLLAAIVRRRRGMLIGGEEGRALVNAAEGWMTSQQIRSPAQVSAAWASGFGR